MVRYQKIYTQIWQDEKFCKLTEKAKFLFFYILTSPHSNPLGLYVLPEPYIHSDLKWLPKQLGKPFGELVFSGLIKYDKSVSLIFIVNQLKYDPPMNGNIIKYWSELFLSLPKSELNQEFIDKLKRLAKPFTKPLEELSRNGMPNGMPTPSPSPSPSPSPLPLPKDSLSGKPDFMEVLNYLNLKAEKKFLPREGNLEFIKARLKEGMTIAILKRIIDSKVEDKEFDRKYLRPATLFNKTKCAQYEGQLPVENGKPNAPPTHFLDPATGEIKSLTGEKS